MSKDITQMRLDEMSCSFVHANGIELRSGLHGVVAYRDGGILFAWPWEDAIQVEKFIAAEKRKTYIAKKGA